MNNVKPTRATRGELVFAGGESAWLIPKRIKNYDKVFNYVANLPPAVLKN